MIHKPISIQNIAIYFPHKICFEDFSSTIHPGNRIAIMGRNGSGKSSLLRIIQGISPPTEGEIDIPRDVKTGYVPQTIENLEQLSGGQRFNKALTQALANNPNVLLLDEPTNHLDTHNRKSLMRMLQNFQGTLIIITHDLEVLRHQVDTLWHIENGRIQVFSGNYNDYIREMDRKREEINYQLTTLNRQKKDLHTALMKEQVRASKSKVHGEKKYADDKLALRAKQSQGQSTHNNRKKQMAVDKSTLLDQLTQIHIADEIKPKFSIDTKNASLKTVLAINDGAIGYETPLLRDINLSLFSGNRIAIKGSNGSGKSTLIKAILGDKTVIKSGTWHTPPLKDIGYLDQHYSTLNKQETVLETIHKLVKEWSHEDVRRHLNDFLFRKNEEVNAKITTLSGGEKARLTLAQTAAKTPQLLILDEITNNLDLETRNHIIQVLKNYPGTIIIISHDNYFLEQAYINESYQIKNGTLQLE